MKRFFADVLRKGQERGEIRQDLDVELKAAELASFMDGAQVQAGLDPKLDLVALYEQYTIALLRDLSAKRRR